ARRCLYARRGETLGDDGIHGGRGRDGAWQSSLKHAAPEFQIRVNTSEARPGASCRAMSERADAPVAPVAPAAPPAGVPRHCKASSSSRGGEEIFEPRASG